MRIGICDDETIIREGVMELCKEFKDLNLIQYEIVRFSSGDELLKYEEQIDILFLDIQMKGTNGLKTAVKIRDKEDNMIIIFLTGYTGYMQEGYKVRAFRYLLKPIKEEEFMKVMGEAIGELKKNAKAILIKGSNMQYVKIKDILYIEYINEKRCTLIRTINYCYESTTSMIEWEAILNNGDFFRVHKSYIVNMEFIKEIGNGVTMDNEERVEVSFRQVGKLKKACREYRRRNAR